MTFHLGIYLVRHPRGRREVVISGSAQVAAVAVAELVAEEAGVEPPQYVDATQYVVARIGDYDPGMTGAQEVAASRWRPSVAGFDPSAWIISQPRAESAVVREVLGR
jgi:hypothetical protein